ncbi:urea carboxylase [Paenibacillus sp. HW567]|uniref:urea carboxylase n=1 Tax=Paenibacillus sp. HW567 TaxID=1034769 RepID=UPI0003606016|nr:urea carboxylase [Paenibacillus sp. HW567]
MFTKVLIANRGAIAVRIERTLRAMGIASVAVYTTADQASLHVAGADEAVLIGEGAPQMSYLNAELILQIAKQTGAEAIHPGYGFLSENAGFARACREQGIVFIGPSPEQIEIFGLKHSAREIAEAAGVPLLPGTPLLTELEEALHAADAIGYPVMLKSTAGGGGIGMRVCGTASELKEAFTSVTHLAAANFNNGGVFVEKYIAKARHIEVQIFGNRLGEIAVLGERDCSIQRRNQKVVEETPAPLLPQQVRAELLESARKLAAAAGYRSAGTVEFLYDPNAEAFYFLEVNTRLQVEHGVTEEVLGLDLVEWMVREAADELYGLQALVPEPQGHSIQARIYAEDCLRDFRPSAGRLDQVILSSGSRNETWVTDGVEVSTLYDPMLAKVIVHGKNREEAIQRLEEALSASRFYGVTTNLSYICGLLREQEFTAGRVYTRLLDGLAPSEDALEVIDGGVQTTVQDYPGRTGYWDVGVPPCGPVDPLSFRIGNKLLGNPDDAPGLELTLRGGAYRFRGTMWFCLTGADMKPVLDGLPVPMFRPVLAEAGQTLVFGEAQCGMRTYLLLGGGLDMPLVLGSASTFTLGGFGGHGGRAVRTGDVLGVKSAAAPASAVELLPGNRPALVRHWSIGVIPGPHSTEEFLKPSYLEQLTGTEWEVHFNSSRTGVRLMGPAPLWAREDGGDAGLHPSNIHDNAYSIGALDLTGDMPILLGPDGPSLGGFVCPVTTASAEFWKIGQLRPGDLVSFRLLTLEDAERLRQAQEQFLIELGEGKIRGTLPVLTTTNIQVEPDDPILHHEEAGRQFTVTIRASGDANLLVEYGEMELNLLLRFQVHALMQAIQEHGEIPVTDLTPGIRSLQIHLDASRMTVKEAALLIAEIDRSLPPLDSIRVPSRIVHLPLSWDDPATRIAIERYQQTVRPDAPWCPSNIEFIRRINGLDSIEEVKNIVFEANYLVLGLGDVYLGAPVATPVDPRHRLVTTKYNPARTWTPENAVGIGGAYLCVYGMEGPGGYQFVGRTIQMWNRLRSTASFQPGKPWLLRFFDQIRFYPVSAEELLTLREDFLLGRFDARIEETTFDLGEYLDFLASIDESTAEFRARQQKAFKEERESWKKLGLAEYMSEQDHARPEAEQELPPGTVAVRSDMPGSVWKIMVTPGQQIHAGDTVVIQESMKMEFNQKAASSGTVEAIYVAQGDTVQAGQLLVSIVT